MVTGKVEKMPPYFGLKKGVLIESKKRTHCLSPDLVEGEKRIIFLLYQILQQICALVQDSVAHWVGTEGIKLQVWKPSLLSKHSLQTAQ